MQSVTYVNFNLPNQPPPHRSHLKIEKLILIVTVFFPEENESRKNAMRDDIRNRDALKHLKLLI